MTNFKLWNRICGWVVFAIAAATYLMTMEPTASFWDCGEFISSAWKLDVGHPPGAPFFMLMGHFASLFASDVSHVAMCVNALSALASAFTILFLFWTITALGKKLIDEMTLQKMIALLGAGTVGALAYTFSDTFWFSAVEGEVYASSSLFTAVVFWAILKWDEHAEESGSDRWLILIAYLMGLSIGVHLLNLLTIPAIVLVYYFHKYEFSWKGVFIALLASVLILAAILYGMIPGVPTLAGWFELFFVNALHLPFNTGLFVYLALAAIALVWTIVETNRNEELNMRTIVAFVLAVTLSGIPFLKESATVGVLVIAALSTILIAQKEHVSMRILNTAAVMIAVLMIGYSSYAAIVIRSAADTPMDQNSPDNVFSLKYYLNREQYGDTPLLYGQVYNAPVKLEVKGNLCVPVEKQGHAQYAPKPKTDPGERDEYMITGYKSSYEYMDEFKMFFPRMHSGQPSHVAQYKAWANVKGKKVKYTYCGQQKTDYCPTFAENMRFFFNYQVHWMYWRYFMWNFAGRQSDLQNAGGTIDKGNWICGIPFIDNARLGDQSLIPSEMRENKGRNVYYLLPLLLGIVGIVYQLSKRKSGFENFTLTALLFLLTGLAIVVYLNQTPIQPRERDYAYAGSFYAYCIWMGIGVMGIAEWLGGLTKSKAGKSAIAALSVVLLLGVPALMAQQNWDDHDRSGRYSARDFGANYLKSCEKHGVIFSNGDNDTFPLWYNQEVEEVGTDLRVCNLSYLQTDWYIGQMKRPYYDSPALPITWEQKDFMSGKNEVVWVNNRLGKPIDVETAFAFVRRDDARSKQDGENYIPSDQLYIPVNPEEALGPNSVFYGRYTEDELTDRLNIKMGRRLTKSEMMVLEIIDKAKWQRPVYFAATVGPDYYQGLEPYMENVGLAYQITPVYSRDYEHTGRPRVNIEKMYDNMMNKFLYGGMNRKGVYIDENLMRMCRTHRMMFAELAGALLDAGDKERCVKVLDKAEAELPGYNIPYDYTSATMACYYFECGERAKAEAIMMQVGVNCAEYLMWGSTLDKQQRQGIQRTLQQDGAILGFVIQQCDRFGAKAIVDEFSPIYAQFAR
ncbi:MAG: DUF2723 domain-containing protein [Paludibacteraceae bacterium]|nr:DUF2723 domain-containing protein [Paludibacteraceae bacterium]